MELNTSHVSVKNDDIEVVQKEAVNIGADGAVVDHGLHRALKQRHLQMIALGGVVGFVFVSGCGLKLSLNDLNILLQGKHLVRNRSRDIVLRTGNLHHPPVASDFEDFGLLTV
jgi:hypothetical protein